MVVGLGRFGAACAECLTQLGHDVIGVDSDERLVQKYMATLAQSVQADATDIDAMRLVGAGEVGTAVVAIGGDNVGEVVDGLARFPINLRYPRDYRDSVEQLRRLPIVTDRGAQIVLSTRVGGDAARGGLAPAEEGA